MQERKQVHARLTRRSMQSRYRGHVWFSTARIRSWLPTPRGSIGLRKAQSSTVSRMTSAQPRFDTRGRSAGGFRSGHREECPRVKNVSRASAVKMRVLRDPRRPQLA